MVFNAHQRHEGRRCLPKGTRDRNQLVLKHMGLAHCVATRQQQRGLEEHDDLLQEARPRRPVPCGQDVRDSGIS